MTSRLPALFLLVLPLAACQNTPPPVQTAGAGGAQAEYWKDPQITVLATELRPYLEFMPAVRSDPEVDGAPLSVEVPMRNNAARKYLLEYRYLFYDRRGFEETPVMDWKFVAVEPGQVVRLDGNAYDRAMRDYKLEIRWSR